MYYVCFLSLFCRNECGFLFPSFDIYQSNLSQQIIFILLFSFLFLFIFLFFLLLSCSCSKLGLFCFSFRCAFASFFVFYFVNFYGSQKRQIMPFNRRHASFCCYSRLTLLNFQLCPPLFIFCQNLNFMGLLVVG